MKISQINHQPYSEALERRIKEERRAWLFTAEERAIHEPYAYTSTDDILTILFEAEDQPEKSSISLPFRTNVTSLWNVTDYNAAPKHNWVKNMFIGGLDSVDSMQIQQFIEHLQNVDILYLKSVCQIKIVRDRDLNQKNSHPTLILNYQPRSRYNIEKDDSSTFIQQQFDKGIEVINVDPLSAIRVEKRTFEPSTRTYKAELGYHQFTGVCSAPGDNVYIRNIVIAKFLDV